MNANLLLEYAHQREAEIRHEVALDRLGDKQGAGRPRPLLARGVVVALVVVPLVLVLGPIFL